MSVTCPYVRNDVRDLSPGRGSRSLRKMSRGCPSDIEAREVISVLLTIKRWTIFVNSLEFTMPENLGIRIILFEAPQ